MAAELPIDSPPREQSTPAPIERPELRGERSKTYRMPDGSLRTKVYGGPIHVRDGSGRFEPIDSRLIPDAAPRRYRNARAAYVVSMGPEDGGLAPVTVGRDGWTATLDLLGATELEPLVVGSKGTYQDVLKDTNLVYESVDDGLKETLVLGSAAAPTTYTFRLEVSGAKLKKTEDGGWAIFKEGKDEPETWLGGLMVWDSSRDANGEPQYCADATMNVVPSAGGALVSYEVPAKWLRDPSRKFPVMIDPSFLPSHDAYVKNGTYAGNNYGTATNLKVGEEGAANDLRSYLRFTLSSIPSDVYVHQVTLNPYLYSNNSAGTAMYLDRVTSYWSQNTITFNSQPTCVYDNQKTMPSAGQWVPWDITSLGRRWIDGSLTNNGVRLRQSAGSGYLRYFYSYDNGTYRPYTQVDYEVPTATVSGYRTQAPYTANDSDEVAFTVDVQSAWPGDVRDVQVAPNRTHADTSRRRGLMGWFKTNPGAGWVATQVAGYEGYFAYSTETSTGTSYITPLMNQSTVTTEASARKVTFKYKLKPDYGDIQDNDLDTFVSMGTTSTVWTSGWKSQDTNIDVLPGWVSTITQASANGLGWWRESDRDGDGQPDKYNDKPKAGRGQIQLAWDGVGQTANGYKIMLHDGFDFREVARLTTTAITSWDSSASGIFPGDTEIASWPAGRTKSAYYRAMSPGPGASEAGTVTLEGGHAGAGVVLSDGSYLYVRAWGSGQGPDSWLKVGSGLAGTVSGKVYATVGQDFSAKEIMSAFYLDGFLYNGYATAADRVEGVWKGEEASSTDTREFTFSGGNPLDRATGNAITAASGNILLASDGSRVYSVSYKSPSYDGFKIREFSREGVFIADHTTSIPSYEVRGVLADGEALYLIEWTATNSARVTKIRTSDWKAISQWSLDQGDTKAIQGTYDPANKVFWLGKYDGGTVYRYAGPGLDLRDWPDPLYAKMGYYAYGPSYRVQVIPYNSAGSPNLGAIATMTIPGRSARVNDDPRHTVHELDQAAGHSVSAVLDRRSLGLSVNDLSIASWGPPAAVSRSFDSSSTDATGSRLAPGWRFNFDQELEIATGSVTYADEAGEEHRYDSTQSAFHSPVGDYSTLTSDTGGYTLEFKDRSHLRFDTSGRLTSHVDSNDNAVTYSWTASQLTITAANGQSIAVSLDASGNVTRADHATTAGTRRVDYTPSPTAPAVTYWPGTTDAYEVRYGYDSGGPGGTPRLTSLSVPDFDSSGTVPATWGFAYPSDSVSLSSVHLPGYGSNSYRRADIAYAGSTATITRFGQVRGTDNTPVTQTYAWNPTHTEAWRTNPKASGDPTATWSYEYAPTNEVILERSPLGKDVHRDIDAHGNTLYDYDQDGDRTSYVYDTNDLVIRQTDPRGSTTYRTYDSKGNVTVEERVLATQGDRSRTERTYDGEGRVTSEKRKIDASAWAETTYSNHAPNGEAQTQVDKGVKLSTTATAQDLTTYKSYDAFGNLVSDTDALGTTTNESTFTASGRTIWSRDASGTYTRHAYDVMGNETETSKTAGTAFADWTKKVVDPEGETVTETYFVKDGSQVVVDHTVTHSYDSAGREVRSIGSVEGTTTTHLDAAGSAIEKWVPQASGSTRAAFDVEGRETSRREAGNDTSTTTAYLPDGQVLRQTNADGTWTEYRYDEGGNKTAELTPSEEGTVSATSRYDVGGRLISSTNAEGATTTHAYDLLDRQISVQGEEGSGGAAGPSTTTHNTLGWVLSETDSDGSGAAKTYDAAGRVVREVDNPTADGLLPNGSFETDVMSGDWYGLNNVPGDGVADKWEGSGGPLSITFTLDSTGALSGSNSQKAVVTGGSGGEVIALRSYTAPWSYILGRNAIATCWIKGTAQGASVKLRLVATDNYGDPTEEGDPHEASQTVNLTDSFQKVQIVYDDYYPNGPSPWTERMRLEVVVFDYNQGDTVELYLDDASVVYAAPGQDQLYDQVTTRGYSPAGSLLREVAPDGAVKTAIYDSFQRTTEETETREGATLKAVSTRYDELGRTASRTNAADGVRTTAVHARNGVWGTTASLSYADATTTASIDGSGRELSRRASVGSIETSRVIGARDAAGRVTSWTWNTNATSTAAGVSYDGADRLATLSGLGFGAGGASFTYSQATGKKTGESYDLAFASPSADITASYAYTEGGRLATATIGSTTTAYGYDQAGNLTTAGALVLRYDENNRLTHTELSGTTQTVFAFDERGRRVTEGPPSAPSRRAYVYDNADRLVSIIDTAAETTATFAYDAAGQRTRSVVTTVGGTTETTYTYDGLTLLALESRTATRSTKLAYLYDESGRPYAGIVTLPDTSPILFGLVTTDRGDVVELVDGTGTAFALYLYDAYGNPTGTETTSTPGGLSAPDAAMIAAIQPLRYAGYSFDAFSGLYYLSARYYDPASCQFVSKDPAKADGEESSYQYCRGDPIGGTDPSGRYIVHKYRSTSYMRLGAYINSPKGNSYVGTIWRDWVGIRWWYKMDWWYDSGSGAIWATAQLDWEYDQYPHVPPTWAYKVSSGVLWTVFTRSYANYNLSHRFKYKQELDKGMMGGISLPAGPYYSWWPQYAHLYTGIFPDWSQSLGGTMEHRLKMEWNPWSTRRRRIESWEGGSY